MKRAIFRKFIQLLVFALIINSVIFYIAASSMLLRNSRENMQFTLETLDHMFNYSGDLDSQVRRIGQVNAVHDSRLTIIDLEGNVAADTGVADTSAMDNHLEREEVQDAINGGTGVIPPRWGEICSTWPENRRMGITCSVWRFPTRGFPNTW